MCGLCQMTVGSDPVPVTPKEQLKAMVGILVVLLLFGLPSVAFFTLGILLSRLASPG